MTSYTQFLSEVLSHPVQGPLHADLLVGVVRNIVDMEKVVKMTGGDPEGIDGLIDAQLDRLIVASNGEAMQALTGRM